MPVHILTGLENAVRQQALEADLPQGQTTIKEWI